MNKPVSMFLSHGSPMIAVEAGPAADFLRGLGRSIPKPQAVIAVSAHWPARSVRVGGAARPKTIHDYWGFPPELYALDYPAPGNPDLARNVAEALGGAAATDRGLDHGIWTVMRLLWPEADVPTIPVAVLHDAGAAAHMRMGAALRPFAENGALIIGTGAATHNLSAWSGKPRDARAETWVTEFADALVDCVVADDRKALADWTDRLPYARMNHPDDDHLSPFFAALGAGRGGGRVLHRSVEHATIAMDAYAWD